MRPEDEDEQGRMRSGPEDEQGRMRSGDADADVGTPEKMTDGQGKTRTGRLGEDGDPNGNRRGRGELAAVSRGSVGKTRTLKPALIPC
jgi:hypothetical protein